MAIQRILVTGATGAQGGGVARHLLARGDWRVRALTRNPRSEKALALARAGAEVVPGDLNDPASLTKALEGCTAVFGVTSFWEHFAKEYELGQNLVDAVAASRVQRFIFSTLPSASKISAGAIRVPHFDMKADLEDYTRTLGLPAIFTHAAFYYENWLTFFPPRRQPDGSFAFGFPQGDTPLAAVAVADMGGIVAAILDRGTELLGKTVPVIGECLPPAEYAAIMSRVLGRKIVYQHVPRSAYASLGFPGAEELADMFEFNRLYLTDLRKDMEQSRALYPNMQSFEPWLTAHRERFTLHAAGGAGL